MDMSLSKLWEIVKDSGAWRAAVHGVLRARILRWLATSPSKTEGKRRRGWQRMRWLESITNSMDMSLSKLWEIVKDRGDWHGAVHRVSKTQRRFSD